MFHVTGDQISAANAIRIKVPAGATTLVDVDGRTVDLTRVQLATVSIWDPVTERYIVDDHFINGAPVPSTVWLTLRQSLLWNVPDVTSMIKNSAAWPGTILAPRGHLQFGFANVIGPGHVDGSIVVDSVDSVPGAETHDMTFVGLCLPEEPMPTGSITLVKQVSGPPPTAATTFTIVVDCGTEGGVHDVALRVPVGATQARERLSGLPVGTVCAVREPNPPPGWQFDSISPSTVTVPAVGEPEVTVTATNLHELGTVRLVKRLDGPAAVAGSVAVRLACTDGTVRSVLLTVPAGSTRSSATVSGIVTGAVCTVTETATTPDWEQVSVSPSSVTVGDANSPPVVIAATNARRLGSLQLVKQTVVPPTVDTAFGLDVDCDGTSFERTVTITVAAGSISALGRPIGGIPYGTTCSVTESSVPTGWDAVGIVPSSVVIGAAGSPVATITATNARGIAGLELRKDVTGPPAATARSFVLHVDCSDGSRPTRRSPCRGDRDQLSRARQHRRGEEPVSAGCGGGDLLSRWPATAPITIRPCASRSRPARPPDGPR